MGGAERGAPGGPGRAERARFHRQVHPGLFPAPGSVLVCGVRCAGGQQQWCFLFLILKAAACFRRGKSTCGFPSRVHGGGGACVCACVCVCLPTYADAFFRAFFFFVCTRECAQVCFAQRRGRCTLSSEHRRCRPLCWSRAQQVQALFFHGIAGGERNCVVVHTLRS